MTDFRSEYLACLRDRDQQYLKHEAREKSWAKERQVLTDRIAVSLAARQKKSAHS